MMEKKNTKENFNDNNDNKKVSYQDLINQVPAKWRDQPPEVIREMWASNDSIPIPVDIEKQEERTEELKKRKEIVDKLEEYEKRFNNTQDNKIDIEKNVHIINDFGYLLTLNSAHLDDYATSVEGKSIIKDMINHFNSKIINGLSFADFINDGLKKDINFLKKDNINTQLINAIKQYIPYIEARIKFLKPESNFIKQFDKLKNKLGE